MELFKDQCPSLDGTEFVRTESVRTELVVPGAPPRSAWEVDDEIAADLERAEEIYHGLPGVGHLFQVASPVTS